MPRAFNLSFNLNLHRLVPGFELRRRGNSQLRQALAAALERASLHPGLDLVARSVHTVELMIEIGPDVLAPAIGHTFEKERAGTGAQAIERGSGSAIDFVHVVAVDAQCFDLEGTHAFH